MDKRHPINWEDLRYFRAVFVGGSIKEAGAFLGVNPSTVARRLSALEDTVHCKLFLRGPGGTIPTREAEMIMKSVSAIERRVLHIVDVLSGDAALDGEVRIATSSAMATWFISPLLADFRAQYPGISVNLICTAERVDSIRATDVAVWMGRPTDQAATARRLAEIEMGIFGAAAYVRANRAALESCAGEGVAIIDYSAEGVKLGQWLKDRWPAARVALSTNDVHVCLEAMLGGLGLGVFPGPMGAALPGLVRVDGGALPTIDVWRVSHRDVIEVARVRVVTAFLDRIFSEQWTSGGEILSRTLRGMDTREASSSA